ncbi:MAG: HEAT repeat domain-containing protein [Chryseolinea sp.]
MEKDKLEALLIDYIDGRLNTDERIMVEDQLRHNPEAATLYVQLKEVIEAMGVSSSLEPSGTMQSNFNAMLESEMRQHDKGKTVFFSPTFYRVAAAFALVILGGAIVFLISRDQEHKAQMTKAQEEIAETKRMMMSMLDNQHSASQRLMGATVAYEEVKPLDDDVVVALIRTMNDDPNTNVRIAALEALGKFNTLPHVRKALIASLSTQKDPLVQIALIRFMVEMKAQGIKSELERITTDEETLPAVKDEAHAGLLRLS